MNRLFWAISVISILFLGCSKMEVNTPMCDEINEEHPRDHIPKRCRNYNKEEAQKAFRKAEDEKQQSSEDLKFNGQVNGE